MLINTNSPALIISPFRITRTLISLALVIVLMLLAPVKLTFAGGSAPLAAQSAPPTLSVQKGTTRSIYPDFIGFNGNLSGIEAPWSNETLLNALAQSQATNLRYPGGTVANFWDWDEGKISDQLNKEQVGVSKGLLRHRVAQSGYKLENLALAIKRTGATPIFVLNMTQYGIEQQIEHLKQAHALGMPIRYVELGNEIYFGSGAHPIVTKRFPTAEAYGKTAMEWIATVKKQFPGVKVAVVAAGPVDDLRKSARRRSWDERLFKVLKGSDAITLHLYIDSGLAEKGRDDKVKPWGEPGRQREQLGLLRTRDGIEHLLSQPWKVVKKKLANADYPSNIDIWVTEFNIWETTGAIRGTWAHGLAVANFINAFLSEPRIQTASYHNFFAQSTFTAAWRFPDEFKHSAQGTTDRPQQYALNGPGETIAMYGAAMRGMTKATRLIFNPQPLVAEKDKQPGFPTVIGWVFSDGVSERALVVNLTATPVTIQSGNFAKSGYVWRQVSAPPDRRILNETSIIRVEGKLGSMLQLPPYSLTLIK